MNLKKKLQTLPLGIRGLIKTVSVYGKKKQVKVYLVGGMIRDLILGKMNYDLDLVTEGDAIEFAKELSEYLRVGFRKHHRFKTATVFSQPHKIDLATSRKEVYSHWGALPRVEESLIGEDLKRRDFTVNALALSLNQSDFGEVLDVVGGVEDLKKGLIKVLHKNSFLEDPTRILRAVRFKKRLGFKFGNQTQRYLRKACNKSALNFVNHHRLRDEIILILKEEEPLKYIREINKIVGFSFLGIPQLGKTDFYLFQKINKSIGWFKNKFGDKDHIDIWIVYLMGLFSNVHVNRVKFILALFGFNKKERVKMRHSKRKSIVKDLSKDLLPSRVYKLLSPLSCETIVFFYALSSDKKTKQNIEDYLSEYRNITLNIKGHDLKKMGIPPSQEYTRILKRIFYKKINKKIISKEQELKEAQKYRK